MDQSPSDAAPSPAAPEAAPTPAPEPPVDQPIAHLFGVPVIIWVLIAFIILIAILAWFDLISGDLV